MAKKKVTEPDDDLDDFSLEDEEIESVYPEIEKKESKKEDEPESLLDTETSEEDFEDDEIEEEPEIIDYKFLKLELKKNVLENDYELLVINQSHGFCNILVKHLLNVEGVKVAVYKITKINPTQVFIRLESNKYKIKSILHQGIEALREEVLEVQKVFKKFM